MSASYSTACRLVQALHTVQAAPVSAVREEGGSLTVLTAGATIGCREAPHRALVTGQYLFASVVLVTRPCGGLDGA